MVQKVERLKAWNEAHKLVLDVYKYSIGFPGEEKYGLTSQLRRSAASICANLAEGCERKTLKDYIHFIYISKGSLGETRYHLLLAKDLGYINITDYAYLEKQCDFVAAIIQKLITALEKKLPVTS